MNQEMLQRIDKIFQLWQDHPGAGGQLVVTHKGQTILERCYGYANIETQTPITQDTVFHVASMSKMFASMSIFMLQERGLLHVDDDVRKYLPDIVKYPQKITIRNMIHHTSGLRDQYKLMFLRGLSNKDCHTQQEALRVMAKQRALNFEPGTEFCYSNPNYVFQSEIVERLTGMSLNEFCKENIFGPLGMDHTVFRDDPEMLIPNRANSYHDDGQAYRNAILNISMYGDSCLQTTCRDMTKFFKQFTNPTLISRETMNDYMLNIPPLADGRKTNYAGGVRMDVLEGHPYIHHGGVNAGFRTFGVTFPEDDLIVVVFTNTYNIPIETAGRDVARVVLGMPERKLKNLDAYTTDGVDAEQIPGYYIHDASATTFDIREKGGQLYLDTGYMNKLEPIGGNLYKMGRRNITFAFGENPAVNNEDNVMPLRKLTGVAYPECAAEYVGEYYSDETEGHFTVAYEDGKLWLIHNRLGRQELHLLKGHTFCFGCMAGLNQIEFLWGTGGIVSGFVYIAEQVRRLPFTKID